MSYFVIGDNGETLDTTISLDGGELIFHSRGGVRGRSDSRNLDYGVGLRMLLQRIQGSSLRLGGAWLDSRDTRMATRDQRRILFDDEGGRDVTDQFRLMSDRMQSYGRPAGAPRGGSRVKRVRLALAGPVGFDVFLGRLGIVPKTPGSMQLDGASIVGSSQDPDDSWLWIEGRPALVMHLRRERAPGLVMAKREAFIREFGRLRCERCGLDPAAQYGEEFGASCIEVHHSTRHLSEMEAGHETRLDDLQCLCANCHRVVHAMLRAGMARNKLLEFIAQPC